MADYSDIVKMIEEEIILEMADGVLDDPPTFVEEKLLPHFRRILANVPELRSGDEIDQALVIAQQGKRIAAQQQAIGEWREKFQEQLKLRRDLVAPNKELSEAEQKRVQEEARQTIREFDDAGQQNPDELVALIQKLRKQLKEANTNLATTTKRNKELGATLKKLRELIPGDTVDQTLKAIRSGKLEEDERIRKIREERKNGS
jgi:hypothetical protein